MLKFFCLVAPILLCLGTIVNNVELYAQEPNDLDSLIKANERTWELISAADAQYDYFCGVPGKMEAEPPKRWFFSVGKERFVDGPIKLQRRDDKGNIVDVDLMTEFFYDRERFFVLHDIEPKMDRLSRGTTPVDSKGLSCILDDRHPKYSFAVAHPQIPSFVFMKTIGLGRKDVPRTLAELANEWNVTLENQEDRKTGELVHLHAIPKNEDDQRYMGTSFEIFLDPSVGFLIKKIIINDPPKNKLAGLELDFSAVSEVVEFFSFGNGIYFPKTIVKKPLSDDSIIMRYHVGKIALNRDVDTVALDFTLPENLLVALAPVVDDGYTKVAVWGPKNKPKLVLNDEEEYSSFMKRYEEEQATNRYELPVAKRLSLIRWVFILLGVLLIILSIYINRREKKI